MHHAYVHCPKGICTALHKLVKKLIVVLMKHAAAARSVLYSFSTYILDQLNFRLYSIHNNKYA